MAAVHKSRWHFFAVVLLVVLAAIWVVRGSGSNDPVQAAPVTIFPSGAESSWSKLDIISGEGATLGHSIWSDAFSVRIASQWVSLETRWSDIRREGNLIKDAPLLTKSIDSGAQAPVSVESDESVPSDTQIDLAHHTNDSHGGVTMITTATVLGPIPEDSDGGVPAP